MGIIAGPTSKPKWSEFRISWFVCTIASNLLIEISHPAAHLILDGVVHCLIFCVKNNFAYIRLSRLHS
jgi:hypothetical protein